MVVDNLNLVRLPLNPGKADAVLVVDANAILGLPFAFESLQTIAGRYPKLFQRTDGVKLIELSPRGRPQTLRANASGPRRGFAVEHILGPIISKRPYHDSMIARNTC